VGEVQAQLAEIARLILEPEAKRDRKAGGLFDSPNPSWDEIKKMADFMAQVNMKPKDAAYLSYVLESFGGDAKYRQIPDRVIAKLYSKAVSTYRKNLFEWFSHGLIKRANVLPGTTVNRTLSAFVLDIPEAILKKRAPEVETVAASWRFLNLDLLPRAGVKVAKVVMDDAMRAGLWKADKENAIRLVNDRSRGIWYIPKNYRRWTWEHKGQLGRHYGFQWDADEGRWYTEKLNPKMKADFLIPGQSVGRVLPPSLDELRTWYINTWLPKNIQRFDALFSNVLPPKGTKLDYTFKVQRNGNVKVVIRGGINKISDAIEELRARYINRQGRGPWLEVMDKVIELSRGGGPDKVMHIIDRANNLEHSNGMFMEHFPSSVLSWYGKFLNAKYNAPTAGVLGKYIGDSDLRDIVKVLDSRAHMIRKPKIEDGGPAYHEMEKEGPDDPGPNWRKLKYPYPKGTPKHERDIRKDDPRVQKGLGTLRSRGSSAGARLAFDKNDMKDFANEIIRATGRDWEIHTVDKDSIFLVARIEDPATSATISIGRDGRTKLALEAFDDDTDYEAWDEFKWKALPSDPDIRPKLVRAIEKKLDGFLRGL
jgi:hypothetical protein